MSRAKKKTLSVGNGTAESVSKDQGDWPRPNPNYGTSNAMQHAATMPAAAVVAQLQVYAAAMGLSLTARCRRCGAPLWAAQSLHVKLGPVCRRRTESSQPVPEEGAEQ